MTPFLHGFADELVKTARIGQAIKRFAKKHEKALTMGGVGLAGAGALTLAAGGIASGIKKGRLESAYTEGYNNWADYQNNRVDEINKDIEANAQKNYGKGLADLNEREWSANYDQTMTQPRWAKPHEEAFSRFVGMQKKAGVLSVLKKIPVPEAVKHLGRASVDIAPWLAVGYLLGRRGKKRREEREAASRLTKEADIVETDPVTGKTYLGRRDLRTGIHYRLWTGGGISIVYAGSIMGVPIPEMSPAPKGLSDIDRRRRADIDRRAWLKHKKAV